MFRKNMMKATDIPVIPVPGTCNCLSCFEHAICRLERVHMGSEFTFTCSISIFRFMYIRRSFVYWPKTSKLQFATMYLSHHHSSYLHIVNHSHMHNSQHLVPTTSPSFLRILQADIVKQIWAELPKHMSTPVAPLDEEMLSELAKVPAVVEGHLAPREIWPRDVGLSSGILSGCTKSLAQPAPRETKWDIY